MNQLDDAEFLVHLQLTTLQRMHDFYHDESIVQLMLYAFLTMLAYNFCEDMIKKMKLNFVQKKKKI